MDSIDKITAGFKSEIAQQKREKYFSSDLHKSLVSKQALKLADDRRKGIKPPPKNKICDTKPELAVEKVLKNLEISYQKQCPIGPYTFDFYLKEYNILIEVQGEFWHSQPNNIRNDLAKFEFVRKYYSELQTYYIKEIDTKKPVKLYEILNSLTGVELQVVDFDFKDLDFRKIDPPVAIQFMHKFHYLPRFRKTTKATYGVFFKGEIISVIIYGLPSYNTLSKHYGLLGRQVLELSRFIINPKFQKKNLASWALSRSVKAIRNDLEDICLLATFADPHFGHDGTIYKAANWKYDGETRPSYYYQDANGNIIHKKTLWDHAQKLNQSEISYAHDNNYIKINSEPKQKFIMWLKKLAISNEKLVNKILNTKCNQCKNVACITIKGLKKAKQKHDGVYICHSCSLKKKWQQKEYRTKVKSGRKSGCLIPDIVIIDCNNCATQKTIKKNSYRSNINKHGHYICHSCALRRWHKTRIAGT